MYVRISNFKGAALDTSLKTKLLKNELEFHLRLIKGDKLARKISPIYGTAKGEKYHGIPGQWRSWCLAEGKRNWNLNCGAIIFSSPFSKINFVMS